MGATSACRRGTRLMVAGLVTWLVAFFICAVLSAPSSAHSGGKAIPLVTDFTLTPAPSGWNASVTLVDFDGGEALDAVDVRLKGAGLTRLTPMIESATVGTYELGLPKAKPGPVKLELQMRTLPGGTEITDRNEAYDRTLVAGKPLHVAGSSPSGSGSGGGGSGVMVAGAGALILVLVICAMLALRSRAAATEPR